MYYRRGFYPRPGQADVPDDLWAEFQRIRGHLSRVDQNNIESFSLARSDIALPDTPDHAGLSDIVGVDGEFLHKELTFQGSDLVEIGRVANFDLEGRWFDLGGKGALLRGHSRGDAPWIVAASIDFSARDRELSSPLGTIATSTEGPNTTDSSFGSGHYTPTSSVTGTIDNMETWTSAEIIDSSITRVNVRLRFRIRPLSVCFLKTFLFLHSLT